MTSYITPSSLLLKLVVHPSARGLLERPPSGRVWRYLYVDGTFFCVRRTTVAKEPTLVVLGVDEGGFKSVLWPWCRETRTSRRPGK
jgi:transposase-like protein